MRVHDHKPLPSSKNPQPGGNSNLFEAHLHIRKSITTRPKARLLNVFMEEIKSACKSHPRALISYTMSNCERRRGLGLLVGIEQYPRKILMPQQFFQDRSRIQSDIFVLIPVYHHAQPPTTNHDHPASAPLLSSGDHDNLQRGKGEGNSETHPCITR